MCTCLCSYWCADLAVDNTLWEMLAGPQKGYSQNWWQNFWLPSISRAFFPCFHHGSTLLSTLLWGMQCRWDQRPLLPFVPQQVQNSRGKSAPEFLKLILAYSEYVFTDLIVFHNLGLGIPFPWLAHSYLLVNGERKDIEDENDGSSNQVKEVGNVDLDRGTILFVKRYLKGILQPE